MSRSLRAVLVSAILVALAGRTFAQDVAFAAGGAAEDPADQGRPAMAAAPPVAPDSAGNNEEALATARSIVRYLRGYLPPHLATSDLKVNLRLVADDDAEQAVEYGADVQEYRQAVRVAYLVVYMPAAAWRATPPPGRERAARLAFPALRSLYPGADIYLTIFDGRLPVANAQWKAGGKGPLTEVE